jgi:hypothetical protein
MKSLIVTKPSCEYFGVTKVSTLIDLTDFMRCAIKYKEGGGGGEGKKDITDFM